MYTNFNAAAKSYKEGRHGDASLQSKDGHREKRLMQEANARAVIAVIEPQQLEDSNTIDLHGLTVEEARIETIKFVNDNPSAPRLFIITGQGHHSSGRCKVREAIIQLARSKRWSIDMAPNNPGMIWRN